MIPAVTQCNGAAGSILIFAVDGILKGGDRYPVVGQFVRVDLDADFAFKTAGDVGLENTGNGFYCLFQVVAEGGNSTSQVTLAVERSTAYTDDFVSG